MTITVNIATPGGNTTHTFRDLLPEEFIVHLRNIGFTVDKFGRLQTK